MTEQPKAGCSSTASRINTGGIRLSVKSCGRKPKNPGSFWCKKDFPAFILVDDKGNDFSAPLMA